MTVNMKNKIEEEKRLLTEKEKEYIMKSCSDIKKSNLAIVFGVGLIIYAIVSLLWGFAWSGMSSDIKVVLKYSFCCFLLIFCCTGLWVMKHFRDLQMVMKRVKENSMYAQEAIYEKTSGKSNTVYLEMYKNDEMQYNGYNLLVREPLQKGDKVIVLQMRGRAWIYKARE